MTRTWTIGVHKAIWSRSYEVGVQRARTDGFSWVGGGSLISFLSCPLRRYFPVYHGITPGWVFHLHRTLFEVTGLLSDDSDVEEEVDRQLDMGMAFDLDFFRSVTSMARDRLLPPAVGNRCPEAGGTMELKVCRCRCQSVYSHSQLKPNFPINGNGNVDVRDK